MHQVRITDGELREGDTVLAKVDPEWRIGARQAHSGTHVVHAALRQVLGPEALQSGSYNKPGYLRLDFAWTSGLSAATRSEIEEVANLAVRHDLPVSVLYSSQPEARELGAIALFGETYDETVRIVEIGGPWSVELCGGTHVEHSSQIGPVVLIGESSVGSGLRRVEAVVGIDAIRHLAAERALVAELAGLLKVPPAELPGRVEALVERLRIAEKELERLRVGGGAVVGRRRWPAGAEQSATSRWSPLRCRTGCRAGDLRTLATDVRGRFGDRPGGGRAVRRRPTARCRSWWRHAGRRERRAALGRPGHGVRCRRARVAAVAVRTWRRVAAPGPTAWTPPSPRCVPGWRQSDRDPDGQCRHPSG